jgi:hypothetical protein
MKESDMKSVPENMKELKAIHTFRVTIRDLNHFYKIVKWLNDNVGKGTENWTMEGRVRKYLKEGKSVNRKVYIYKDDFDPTSALYLSLI